MYDVTSHDTQLRTGNDMSSQVRERANVATSRTDTVCLYRKDCVTCLRLRSGHTPSNKFTFLMKKINTPNCCTCNTWDDEYHVMMECVQNEPMRRRLLIGRDNNVGACNSVLAVPDSELVKELLYVVKKKIINCN